MRRPSLAKAPQSAAPIVDEGRRKRAAPPCVELVDELHFLPGLQKCREVHALLGEVVTRLLALIRKVRRDEDHPETSRFIFAADLHEVGKLLPAGGAPGGPYVHHHRGRPWLPD